MKKLNPDFLCHHNSSKYDMTNAEFVIHNLPMPRKIVTDTTAAEGTQEW